MHYSCLVIVPALARDAIEEAVQNAMEPYNENKNRQGFWDWYQLGGRWTGALDGYDPETDPCNTETCFLCGGTGTREDALDRFGPEWVEWTNGCNGCRGTGQRVKWPTEWARWGGDICPVEAVPLDFLPHTLITSDGGVLQHTVWTGCTILTDEKWEKHFRKELSREVGKLAVIVDYHS